MLTSQEDGKLDYYLGIEVESQADAPLTLTQSKYIRDLLAKTNMQEVKPLPSPMVAGCKLSKDGSNPFSDTTMYRSNKI